MSVFLISSCFLIKKHEQHPHHPNTRRHDQFGNEIAHCPSIAPCFHGTNITLIESFNTFKVKDFLFVIVKSGFMLIKKRVKKIFLALFLSIVMFSEFQSSKKVEIQILGLIIFSCHFFLILYLFYVLGLVTRHNRHHGHTHRNTKGYLLENN